MKLYKEKGVIVLDLENERIHTPIVVNNFHDDPVIIKNARVVLNQEAVRFSEMCLN
jgi:hypothetical protein